MLFYSDGTSKRLFVTGANPLASIADANTMIYIYIYIYKKKRKLFVSLSLGVNSYLMEYLVVEYLVEEYLLAYGQVHK